MVRREIRNTNQDKRKAGRAAAFVCALLGSAIMGCPKAKSSTPATQDSTPVIVDIEKSSPGKESGYKELKRAKKEKMKVKANASPFQRFFEETAIEIEEQGGEFKKPQKP